MSLIQLLQKNPEQLADKQLHQIIAFAGDGKLRDGNETSKEFRVYLAQVPSSTLRKFVDECLNSGFTDSGLALQDVVNEVGKRLGFKVENGAYQGRQGMIGHDGLWTFPTNHSVVVEVKTTDAYRIETEKLAGYRKALAVQGKIKEEDSSVLLVVGRQDTGELEAQIRGSRNAWDIRLISAESLLRLMFLKETLDDPRTITRICDILIPKEYTRLDDIIDLVFSATEEAKQDESEQHADIDNGEQDESKADDRSRIKPLAFHDACIQRISVIKHCSLVKQSRSTWESPDKELRVVCAVSKLHDPDSRPNYWFAFHPYQNEYLEKADSALLVLGCGTPDCMLAIPHKKLRPWLSDLWTTTRDSETYWHLLINVKGKKLFLVRKKGKGEVEITDYLISAPQKSK